MSRHSKKTGTDRINRLMGLGSSSKTKSYYPDLIQNLKKLEREKEKYQSIFLNALEGIFRATPDGQIIEMNPAMEKLCGITHNNSFENTDFYFHDFLQNKSQWLTILTKLEDKGSIFGLELELASTSSQEHWINLNLIQNTSDTNNIILEGIVEDITERRRAAEELRKTKSYLNNIVNSMPSMLVGVDPNGCITSMNSEAEKVSGVTLDKAKGMAISQVLPDYSAFFNSYTTSKHRLITQEKFTSPSNEGEHTASITAFPLVTNGIEGAVFRIDDITEHEQREAQLLQAQKMQMVGLLAGGIAHDFNNLLTGSIGAVSMMKMLHSSNQLTGDILTKNLNILDNASKRSAELVNQLLTLSRRKATEFQTILLQDVLEQALDIFICSMDKAIDIKQDIETNKAWIVGDASQIEQILLNVFVNAAHAMTIMRAPGTSWGGTLSVALRYLEKNRETDQGSWEIEITDTGIGIAKEHKDKIFSPFYTTKDQGKGTGLGLSMAYSTVEEHGGEIHYESQENRGTSVYLRFPGNGSQKKVLHTDKGSTVEHGKGEILIIDDEKLVCTIASEILSTAGYSPITANSGEEGIRLYKQHHQTIKAVFLDMAMPQLSGQQVYVELEKIHPNIPTIIISGNSEDIRILELVQNHNVAFLEKPFSFTSLTSVLQKILLR